ncbi:diguanylate cyclase [Halochromatium glycolicum]|nr:diguanylate cyclase [Halochromatium glycolicum]
MVGHTAALGQAALGQATGRSPAPPDAILGRLPGVVYQFKVCADGTWQFCYLSPGAETLFEVPVEEAYADHNALTRCLLPEDRAAHQALVEQASRERTPRDHEYQIRTPSGRVKWVHIQADPMPEPDGSVLWNGLITDITEHREGMRRIQHDRDRYKAIVEALPDLVCRSLPDGTLTYVNQAYCDYFGRGRDRLLGRNFMALIPEDEHAFVTESLKECHAGHPVKTYGHRVRRGDGEVRWVQWTDQAVLDQRGLVVELQCVGRDVTAQRRAEAALRASEHRFRQLFNAMQSGFALHDLVFDACGRPCDYRFLSVNPAFERLTGLNASALIGCTARAVLPDLEPVWIDTYAQVAMSGQSADFEQYTKALDKTFEVHAYCPQPGQFACIFLDISTRKRLEATLLEQATKDDLTGLANRRAFISRLEEELARLKRSSGREAAVLMIDLDHFKQINDSFGHHQGDVVLRHCAMLMRAALRRSDQVGRIGGEEFVILLPETDQAAARLFAERLRATIEQTPVEPPQGPPIKATISVGVTALRSVDTTIDTALARADAALYRAKRGGRNRVAMAEVSQTSQAETPDATIGR